MPEQDFLVWAPDGGNVESQATYAADANLANGVGAGIANPLQANKTWRQASVIASVIAQFIQQQLPAATVIDDGTTATILANLTAALQNIAVGANSAVYAVVGGSQQVSINGAGFTSVGAANFVMPASGVADVIVVGGGGGATGNDSATVYASPCGGGGGWSIGTVSATPGTTVTITAGAPGIAAAAGGSAGTGGTSSFGSHLSATGGTGGGIAAGSGATAVSGGGGGNGSGGDTTGGGNYGSDGSGVAVTNWPGLSGASIFGGAARCGSAASLPSNGWGAGGAGSYGSGTNAGSQGYSGVVIVRY
jgi:hypothetical protein